MIRHVANRIRPVVDSLVINCRDEQADAIGEAMDGFEFPLEYALDDEPDQGPLAGIEEGLSAVTEARFALVLACDMPFVEPSVCAFLFDAAAGNDAAVPRLGDGWYQPTHAVYRVDAMHEACRKALEAGEERIVHALDRLDYREIGEDELLAHGSLQTFENVNTAAEFAAAAEKLSRD